jgi:hypothetical protein
MKNYYKTEMTNSRRTSRGPGPGRGPAVEKHWLIVSNLFQCIIISAVIKHVQLNWIATKAIPFIGVFIASVFTENEKNLQYFLQPIVVFPSFHL